MIPGVTTRNRSLNRRSCGLAALLSACQAMSIAIRTVLPEPVAILNANRGRPPLWAAFSCADDVERLGVAELLGGLGQVDRGLGGLDLAEEEAALAVLVAPVGEQVARGRGDVRVALEAPAVDGLADLVDDLVRLLALRVRRTRRSSAGRESFLGRATGTKNSDGRRRGVDLAGHLAVCRRDEVLRRLDERRVDDRVLDRALGHALPFPGRPAWRSVDQQGLYAAGWS